MDGQAMDVDSVATAQQTNNDMMSTEETGDDNSAQIDGIVENTGQNPDPKRAKTEAMKQTKGVETGNENSAFGAEIDGIVEKEVAKTNMNDIHLSFAGGGGVFGEELKTIVREAVQTAFKDHEGQVVAPEVDDGKLGRQIAKKASKIIKSRNPLQPTEDELSDLNYLLGVLCNDALKEYRAIPREESGERGAPLNFGWDVDMKHELDLKAFQRKIEKVKKWHTENGTRDTYLAPMFPVIQSSGTGKSRLIKETQKWMKNNGQACRYILLTHKTDKEDNLEGEHGYDMVYAVPQGAIKKSRDLFIAMIDEQCAVAVAEAANTLGRLGKSAETLRVGSTNRRPSVVLFLDEAQHIAKDDGYLLRVLRWVLRQKPNDGHSSTKYDMVAILAGTSSTLANFYPEKEPQASTTRVINSAPGESYYVEGKTRYSPFITFRTVGCFAADKDFEAAGSEYRQSIRYGRPLFALMNRRGKLDGGAHLEIVRKMILGKNPWHKDQTACLSVLGTRVQMGHTFASVVSDLVAKGYAHLTSFKHTEKDNIATFAFLPDPVCARLAMCLMHEDQTFTDHTSRSTWQEIIKGKDKTFWAKKFGDIFAGGLCFADPGDMGEMACALYVLFCGDILRARADAILRARADAMLRARADADFEDFAAFSVNFFEWLQVMESGGRSLEAKPAENDAVRNDAKPAGSVDFEVNCIQFFRFPLQEGLAFFADEKFLQSLYSKACAVYMPTNMVAVDLLVPCRVQASGAQEGQMADSSQVDRTKYVPIFFSVKTYQYMRPNDAEEFLKKSMSALLKAGVENGLCILAILGQDRANVPTLELSIDALFAEMKEAADEEKKAPADAADEGEKAAPSTETEEEDDKQEEKGAIQASSATSKKDKKDKNTCRLPPEKKKCCSDDLKDLHHKLVSRIIFIHNDVFGIHEALNNNKAQKRLFRAEVFGVHSELLHPMQRSPQAPTKYRADEKKFLSETCNAIENYAERKSQTKNEGA